MKIRRLLAVLFTVVMSLTVGVFAVACTREKAPAVTYTVTFDLNYTGAASVQVSVEEGKTVERPTAPTRSGYTFVEWIDEGGAAFDFDTPITSDITLKATWEQDAPPPPTTYAITFTETAGVTYLFDGQQPTSEPLDTKIEFAVEISPFHKKNDRFAVKVNGVKINANAEDVYTFTVDGTTTVTVEGVTANSTKMGGNGSADYPYTIGTPAQWLGFVNYMNDPERKPGRIEYFMLTDDIDFRGYSVPVVEDMFAAAIFGENCTLSNATIDTFALSGDYTLAGLIADAEQCYVFDLNVEDISVNVTASTSYATAGALMARAFQVGIENVHVVGGSITVSAPSVATAGGIVGSFYGIRGDDDAIMMYCSSSAAVTARGNLSYAGGIAGEIGGDNTDWFTGGSGHCYAGIVYSYATGDLTSEYVSGGIAAFVQPYVAIQNCYFAGTQNATSISAGIAGVLFEEEIVISNCFFTDGEYEYGAVFQNHPLARIYDAETYVADCYYVPNKVFTDEEDNTYDLQNENDFNKILELLKWNAKSWEYNAQSALPEAVAAEDFSVTLGITSDKAFTIFTQSVPERELQTVDLAVVLPLGIVGSEVTWTYNGLGLPANGTATWFSAGYYLDGVRLPEAYLVTDNTDMQDVQLKFVNYAVVAGEYYFTSAVDGRGYKLVLNNNGTAYVVGATNQIAFKYYYFGEANFLTEDGDPLTLQSLVFIDAPDCVMDTVLSTDSKGEPASEILPWVYVDLEGGHMFSMYHSTAHRDLFEAFSYSDVVGTWTSANDSYKFTVDRKGVYTQGGTEKALTWEYAIEDGETVGITVRIAGEEPVTLTFADKTLQNGAVTYEKKKNPYGGTYVIDVYTKDTLTVTGEEELVNGAFTVGDHTYRIDDEGYIVDEEENYYCDENSFVGYWYGTVMQEGVAKEINLVLFGINIHGMGQAYLAGEYFFYTVKSVSATTVTLSLRHEESLAITGTIIVTLAEDPKDITMTVSVSGYEDQIGESVSLKLDDLFRGVWYSAQGVKYEFKDFKVAIDGAEPVDYDFNDIASITVDGGTEVTYDVDADFETLYYGGVMLTRGDLFGSYMLVSARGDLWYFNGKAIAGKGEIVVYAQASYVFYTYTYDTATGTATITLKDAETPSYTATRNENGIVTLTPYGGGKTMDLGVYNEDLGYSELGAMWTGTWEVGESATLTIGAMAANGSFAVTATGTYAAIVSAKSVTDVFGQHILEFYNAQGLNIYTTGFGELNDGTNVHALGSALMVRLDVFYGEWENADGDTLVFDGWGSAAKGYLGSAEYTYQGNKEEYTDEVGYEGDLLYYPIGGYYYPWFYMVMMHVDGYGKEDEKFYPYAAYTEVYDTFEGVGDNEGYAILLVSYGSQEEWAEETLTGVEAYDEDETQGLLFFGNSIWFDAMLGSPWNYMVAYFSDLENAPSEYEFYCYEVDAISVGGSKDELILSVTLYDMVSYDAVYTVTLTVNVETYEVIITSMAPAAQSAALYEAA